MTLNRRHMLAGLSSAGLISACETLDPSVIDGILGSGPLTQSEAASGIKAALNNGIGHAVDVVGILNGFWQNNIVKIPLPGVLQDVQSVMRTVGAGGLLDELHLQLNRGAEKAAPVAKNIFVDAITSLSISDAIDIVRGPDTAATNYLKQTTSTRLTDLFTPIMGDALQDTGALRLMDDVTGRLDNIPLAPKLSANAKSDLIRHGVDYGLDGLFYYIGEEEKAIRENPAERTSAILRRVFGYNWSA